MQLFLRMGGLSVVILGGVLLILSLVGQGMLDTAVRFDQEGRAAQAVVQEKFTRESRDRDGDLDIDHYLTLAFRTQAGDTMRTEQRVSRARYDAVEVGASIRLIYLESDPTRTEINPDENRQGATLFRIIALGCGLVWLGLLWVIGGWAVAAVRARRYGRLEEVKVQEVMKASITINRRPRYRLVWRDGEGREGQSLLYKPGELDQYATGDLITVYHGVRQMWWTGDIGLRPEHDRAQG